MFQNAAGKAIWSKWAVTSRSLFWITEKIFPEEATKTGMFFFPESQWLIDRRLIPRDAPEAAPFFCSFAAKGGNNGESHNHNDLGHFILFCDGDILFADLGAPEYTKKYFSVERYNVLHASSRGHSVPLIDGREQEPGSEHAVNVLECSENASMVRFGLDLCKAYDDAGLSSFHRIFEWDYNKLTLNITDEFVFENQKNNIQEVLITLYEPVAEKPCRLLIKGGSCTAALSFDAGAKVTIIKDKFRNHYGEDASAYRICLGYEMEVPEFRIKAVISVYNKANPSG